ncbi:hypothetical protein IG631_01796 [Alternaria alternata]|nr:hypothetical protein IG631_01796 [Alternaria alternata]
MPLHASEFLPGFRALHYPDSLFGDLLIWWPGRRGQACLSRQLLCLGRCGLPLVRRRRQRRAGATKRGRWGKRVVPSPFSISGMGATLFFVCWRVACHMVRAELFVRSCSRRGYLRLQKHRELRPGRPQWGRCLKIRLRCEA